MTTRSAGRGYEYGGPAFPGGILVGIGLGILLGDFFAWLLIGIGAGIHPDGLHRGDRTPLTGSPGADTVTSDGSDTTTDATERGGPVPKPTTADREVLPIPDRAVRRPGLRGREGPGRDVPADRAAAAAGRRAERPHRPARRRRLRRLERLRRPVRDADRRAPRRERAQVQPLPHHGALLADPRRRCSRAATTTRSAWAGSRRSRPRRPATTRSARTRRRRWPRRSSSTATRRRSSASATRCRSGRRARWARSTPGRRRRRLRALLRLHRRRDEPVRAGDLRRHGAGRAPTDAGGGLPLHRGHDRPGDRLDPPAEGADAATSRSSSTSRRARPTRRTTCRPSGRTSTRARSTTAGTRCASETFARQKELGVIPPDAELTARPAEIPAWDDMPDDLKPVLARQMEVYAGFLEHTDHHVGRLVDALDGARDPRRHARLLHHRRQRRLGRGNAERLLQRAGRPQRRGRARDDRVHGLEDRRLRHAGGVQPLRGRLGARDGHAVPVDEAGRLALGRHAQRHDRPLAERHPGQGRGPHPVPPRDRRRPDRPRSGRAAARR